MRAAGVLLHLSSLPSPYGMGTMGQTARSFVDFLVRSGMKYWQLLPICPTSYGDSPYQSFSTFAGNPYFIDLDLLEEEGLLQKSEYQNLPWGDDPARVDYGLLYQNRFRVLALACRRLLAQAPHQYQTFCRENQFWLEDYALFMALKNKNGGGPWTQWPQPLKNREPQALAQAREELGEDVDFWKGVQYLFFSQWRALKEYANSRGIQIIGDLPIYVAADSVDVWSDPSAFQLDENLLPTQVAGCPPDGFSATGQLWGNPLYDWEAMARDGYTWWIRRIQVLCSTYDILRIDHFRGFAGYYSIPYGSTDACNGQWRTGPGMALFRAVEKALGRLPIIAEDLGFLTPDVRQLLADSGFPGMKVLEFGFDSRDGGDYLPHTYPRNCVVYTGTHDNEPILGWFDTAPADDTALAVEYLRLTREEGYHWGMMAAAWASVGDLAIVQAQDLLGLGHSSRMNTPSTLGGNWCWRALPGAFDDALAAKIHRQLELYGRLA